MKVSPGYKPKPKPNYDIRDVDDDVDVNAVDDDDPKIQKVDDETLYEDSNYIGRNVCVWWSSGDGSTEHYFGTITSTWTADEGQRLYTASFPDLGDEGEEEDINFLTLWKHIDNYNRHLQWTLTIDTHNRHLQ